MRKKTITVIPQIVRGEPTGRWTYEVVCRRGVKLVGLLSGPVETEADANAVAEVVASRMQYKVLKRW